MTEHMEVDLCEVLKEPHMFSNLNNATQEKFLAKKSFIFQGNVVCLKELLTPTKNVDFDEIIDAELLLKLSNNEKITIGERNHPVNVDVKENYIRRNFFRHSTILSEDEMCNLDNKHYITTIWNSSGSGKSTVLESLAVTLKKNQPCAWVVSIDLNDYSQALLELKNDKVKTITVVDLLNSHPESRLRSNLERNLFSIQDKVVLMIDGVDEVSSEYKDVILDILTDCEIKGNFMRVYITGSSKMDDTLKDKAWMQYRLQGFTRENQVIFLKQYWEHKFGVEEDKKEKCKLYAEKLVTRGWVYEDEDTLVGAALQIRMLAEVLASKDNFNDELVPEWEGCYEFLTSYHSQITLPSKINLFELYQLFIYKNCSKRESKLNRSMVRRDIVKINKECDFYLHIIAMANILNQDQCEFFNCYRNRPEEILHEKLFTFGIIKTINGNPQFTHRTFGEYFLADCISMELPKIQNKQFFSFFVQEILSSNRFSVVRMFLENFISTDWDTVPEEILKDIGHILQQTDNTVFNILAKEGNTELMKFVFKCFEAIGVKPDMDYVEIKGETILHSAMSGNHLSTVELLLKKGAAVGLRDSKERSILHAAAEKNNLNAVKFLVQHGAEVDCKDAYGRTPLHEAATSGSLEILIYLLEQGAYVDSSDREGFTALHEATKNGDFDKVKYLVENGADVNSRSVYGTAIFNVVRKGNFNIVKYLIDKGAKIDFRNEKGHTLLHCCSKASRINVSGKNIEMCKYFLERGLDINSVNKKGNTVLHSVINKEDNLKLIAFLVESGADICRINHEGKTPLDKAIERGAYNVVKYLTEKEAPSENYQIVLFKAVSEGYLDIVRYMREKGKDLGIKDRYGNSTLHEAVSKNNMDMVKFLVEAGLDVNATSRDGTTVLQMAVEENCDFDTVRFLIDQRAKTDNTLEKAAAEGNLTLVKFLIEKGEIVGKIEDVGGNFDMLHYSIEKGLNVNKHAILYKAVGQGDLNIVKYLVGKGAHVNLSYTSSNTTTLHRAASLDHPHIVKYLLKKGAHINAEDVLKYTPLLDAVSGESEETTQILIDHGADVNCVTDEGRTALHFAIENNRISLVKLLVEHDAKVKLKDNSENSILSAALLCKNLGIAEYLVEKDVDVNGTVVDVVQSLLKDSVECNDDSNLVHYLLNKLDTVKSLLEKGLRLDANDFKCRHLIFKAVANGDLKLVKLLLDLGTDVNVKNEHGYILAQTTGDLNVLKFLVMKGADVNFKTMSGVSVLQSVADKEGLDLCKFLVEKGADVNSEDENGRTVLHAAASTASFSKVKYLVEKGAELKVSKDGKTVLHEAIECGDLDLVKFLVQTCRVNVNSKHSTDNTALKTAVNRGHHDVVKFLIKNGANVNLKNINCPVLQTAVNEGHLDIIKYMVRSGAAVNAKCGNGWTSLHEAASRDDFETMKFLVENGADVTSVDEEGRTVLHEAAKYGDVYMVKILIENGAQINVKSKNGRTPFYEAVDRENRHIIKLFAQNGADCTVEDENGRTVLHEAAANDNQELITCLLENGADVNAKTHNGRTAIFEAAANGSLNIIKLLTEKGSDINVRDSEGCTLLHEAARSGYFRDDDDQFNVMEYLIERGADVNVKSKMGRTALHEAAFKCNLKKIRLLVKYGAEVNSEADNGCTPLVEAIKSTEKRLSRRDRDGELVEFLVENGARFDIKTENGRTLLHEAAAWGDQSIIQYFVRLGLDLKSKTKDGRTLLHEAAKRSSVCLGAYLLENGLEVDAKTVDGTTPLHEAAKSLNRLMLLYLIENGADVNGKDNKSRTALHKAAAINDVYAVTILVKAGADVDAKDADGLTVMQIAADDYAEDVVEYLTNYGNMADKT